MGIVYAKGVEVDDLASPTPTTDGSRPLMVALGDSFISGEGAQRYLKGTRTKLNVCHRANTAYPYLVADARDYRLVTAACSGALTDHVLIEGQHKRSPSDTLGGHPQIDVLTGSDLHTEASDIDILVLSIGGNDAGFADIVRTCLNQNNCQRSDREWMRRLEGVGGKLREVYNQVAKQVPDARRILMTYPEILVPDDCVPGLEPTEIRWVNQRFLPRLRSIITFHASVAGFEVVDNTAAFVGARICEDGEQVAGRAANIISLSEVRGTLSPGALVRGSFHPTELGHTLLAAQLNHQLDSVSSSPPPCTGDCPLVPPPDPQSGPPGAQIPFPDGSSCEGERIASERIIELEPGQRSFKVVGAPDSTYCYRNWEERWKEGRAGAAGIAELSTRPLSVGDTISLEVLTQEATQAWHRTVVVLAAEDSVGRASLLEQALTWVVALVVGAVLLAATPCVMTWLRKRIA